MTLGSGAMTNTIADTTGKSDLIMLIGSNPEEAHPVIGMQIRQAVQRGCKLIVVDPRDIDLAKKADVHIKIRPGTNVAFANGIMHVIIKEGLQDLDFINSRTEGYEEIKEIVKDYTPEKVARICHIDEADLRKAAIMYAKADKAPTFAPIAVPNTAAVDPAKDIPENDEPSSPVIPPTTVSILAAATLLKGTASDKTRPISPKSP